MTKNTPSNPTQYLGKNSNLTYCVRRSRRPLGTDVRQPETGKLYPVSTFWQVDKDPTSGTEGELWVLSKIVSKVAYWIQVNSGGGGGGNVSNVTGSNDNAMAIYDGATGMIIKSASALQDGELYIGSTGNTPVASTLTPPSSGFTITNTPGSIKFDLANDLLAIESLNTNGIAVKSGADTWVTRTLVAGSGINITNADGVGGDITISATGGGGGGDVVGPNSSITNNFSSFSDGTGKVIQDSGFNANNFLQVGNDLSDLSDISVARDNLNLGSLALQDSPLDVFHGGTGITTFLQGDILYSPSVNNLSALNIGSNGQILSVLGGLPTWINPPSGSGDVIGPSSSIDSNFVVFDGTSGKIVKDLGVNSGYFLSRQNGMVFLKSNVIDGKVLANHLAFTNVDKFIYAGVYIDWFDVSVAGDAIISLRIGFTPGSNNLFGESFKLRNLLYDNQATYTPSRTRSEVITGITRVIPQGSNVYISVTQAASSATTCNFVMYLTGFYA